MIAYQRAISAIKSVQVEIKEENDLAHLRNVGPKIMDKVIELVKTGKMEKLEKLKKGDKYESIDELSSVWGIGPAKALELYNQNIKTIEELRKN